MGKKLLTVAFYFADLTLLWLYYTLSPVVAAVVYFIFAGVYWTGYLLETRQPKESYVIISLAAMLWPLCALFSLMELLEQENS